MTTPLTVQGFNSPAIDDLLAAALLADLSAVQDANGKTLDAVTNDDEDQWDEFVKQASVGDGKLLVWIKGRASPDRRYARLDEKQMVRRIRVAWALSGAQEMTTARKTFYRSALLRQLYSTVETNRGWGGLATDSYVDGEQEYGQSKPPLRGFEVTFTACYYYDFS